MYTANIVDTVMFRTLGKHPSRPLNELKRVVEDTGNEIWVPAPVYRELVDDGTHPPENPYVDHGVVDGWIRVSMPFSSDRDDDFDSLSGEAEKARFLADEFLNRKSKYPVTNNWIDASVVALAVRLFEQNTHIRIITHTADENLSRACTMIPPEFGYHEIQSEYYYPPKTVPHTFPTTESLTW